MVPYMLQWPWDLLIIGIEAHPDLVALSVSGKIPVSPVIVTTTWYFGKVKDLDDSSASLWVCRGCVDVGIGAVRNNQQVRVGW